MKDTGFTNMEEIRQIVPKPLSQLFDLGGLELVLEMLELFSRHAKQSFSKTETYINEGNYANVSRELHSVKSSLGNVGAEGMNEVVKEMEALILNGETSELMDKLFLLQQALPDVESALEKYAHEMKSDES